MSDEYKYENPKFKVSDDKVIITQKEVDCLLNVLVLNQDQASTLSNFLFNAVQTLRSMKWESDNDWPRNHRRSTPRPKLHEKIAAQKDQYAAELEATIEKQTRQITGLSTNHSRVVEGRDNIIEELQATIKAVKAEIESERANTKRVGIGNVIHNILDNIETALDSGVGDE